MKKMKKNKQGKKTVIKFHYGFLKRIIVYCKKMRSVRKNIFLHSKYILVSIAMLCFFVIVGISFCPFIIDSYKEILQERISVGIYYFLTMSVLWQIGVFIKNKNRSVQDVNQKKTYQKDRRYIDVRRKII